MNEKTLTMQAGTREISPSETKQFVLQPFSYPKVSFSTSSSIPISLESSQTEPGKAQAGRDSKKS
jgi:hypothetical protein